MAKAAKGAAKLARQNAKADKAVEKERKAAEEEDEEECDFCGACDSCYQLAVRQAAEGDSSALEAFKYEDLRARMINAFGWGILDEWGQLSSSREEAEAALAAKAEASSQEDAKSSAKKVKKVKVKTLPAGHTARPMGRSPKGKTWNSEKGEWVDKEE